MKHLNLPFHRRLFFFLILALKVSYLYFLFLFFHQVFSAFLMQLILLMDYLLNYPRQLFSFLSSSEFLINFSAGLFLFFLLHIFFRGLLHSFRSLIATRRFLSQLQTKPLGQYILFDYSKPLAFTAGYFRPQIYLSTASLKTHSPRELEAILLHEAEHCRSRDPLKEAIVSFVKNILPDFPLKSYLFGHYSALAEIACDAAAVNRLSTPLPLVSALTKSASPSNLNLSHFSAQSRRFEVLVGKRPFMINRAVTLNTFLVTSFFLLSFTLTKSNPFYSCSHLLSCLEIVYKGSTSHTSMPVPSTPSSAFFTPLSDHCRE